MQQQQQHSQNAGREVRADEGSQSTCLVCFIYQHSYPVGLPELHIYMIPTAMTAYSEVNEVNTM